jgi:undecaprenyl-diphosphatase
MDIFQALVLGIVQGFTEFLPISSSGHLVFFPQIFGWPEQPLVFDTTLHLATAAALVVYFWRDLVVVVKSLIQDTRLLGFNIKAFSLEGKMGVAIVAGSIPVAVLGLSFANAFELYFRGVLSVSVFLILGSGLMFLAERFSRERMEGWV